MIVVDDIEQYIIRQRLFGRYSFFAQKRNSTNGLNEFIELFEDITYTNLIGLDTVVKYQAKKGDFLDISNTNNIFPVKKADFMKYYKKANIEHNILDLDEVF
ncbi:MAG: hypothetical protein VZS44_09920 [Bacilli bacterium]|nr:hypothetical protein [Bacilli bacterium]